MASSSSSSSSSMATGQPYSSYGVFLSFRGEDTRDGFTGHLYKALNQEGIRTFLDDDGMERGKLLKPELEKAIHESAISLIIFSEGYASSKWCLDEVLMIIEQYNTSSFKHEVVPVFYKVDPSDVRNQTESFKDAFDAYDDKVNAETDLEKKTELLEKVRAWRDSLNKAASFTGLVYNDGMYESKFITNIVDVIRKKLDYKALYIEENLVGVQYHVAEIELWLQDLSPDAAVLLIDGMGGIGKLTIAKCIFNSNYRNYDASCFLAKINETSNQPRELVRLQIQLLSKILKSDKEETIWDVDEGIIKVTNTLSNRKVLVILDDVTTLEQLEALLGPSQRFYPGSKVIITTRHTWLSTAFKNHLKVKVQSVRPLSMREASELFSLYAFHQHQPLEPYFGQSELVVHHCMGVPLALKVLASSLRGKAKDVWEDTMRKLAAIPDSKIQKVLQISHETLEEDTDKDLFLHVACFFEGEEKAYIVKLLTECDLYPVSGIKNLMDRCLLRVENGRVRMHQLIKEMGREVVRKESPKEPGKRSRLWHHQDCIDVLRDQSGTENVQGLMTDLQKTEEVESTSAITMNIPTKYSLEGKRRHGNDANFEIGALEKMKNLMLLQLNYVMFSGTCKKLPRKLRLLRWHGCPLEAIPRDICLEKLVVLDLSHSRLKRVWDDLEFTIGSLKILNLSYSVELTKTPDFRRFPGLENLILEGCSSLIKVDESITYLKKLVLLDLTDCTSLREIPFLPTTLVSLQMSGCGVLGRIQRLNSVPSLSVLETMNISNCNLSDTSFPNDWSSLVLLTCLNISRNKVTSLPNCIRTLPILEHLYVTNCSNIQSILDLPEPLVYLSAMNNKSLETIQVPQSHYLMLNHRECPKLCEIEGYYKVRSIDKVDRKIIRYLGLELNAGEGMESGLKVLHEFGIFSTCVSGKQIPSDFMYKERGPRISFEVPGHNDRLRISGFSTCAVISPSNRYPSLPLGIVVHNMTKDLLWRYSNDRPIKPKEVEKYAWLSLWRCGNLLEAGDEIVIHIIDPIKYRGIDQAVDIRNRELLEGGLHKDVEECGINLIYEEDDEELLVDEEIKKETHHVNVNAVDQISWTDWMIEDISDNVYSGGRKHFCYYNIGLMAVN